MSPEQARGEELDHRTDLFSLGAVLYEMATGLQPFTGNTSAVIFNAILSQAPQPPARVNPLLPGKLEEIILRLMEKDRDLRYQSAADLRSELKRLRRDTDSGRTRASGSVAAFPPVPAGTQTRLDDTSSDSAIVAGLVKRHRLPLTLGGIVLVAALAGLGLAIYRVGSRTGGPEAVGSPARDIRFTQLTSSGNVRRASISPDGKYMVYVQEDNGRHSLWVRQVATDSHVQIAAPDPSPITGLTFSNDGNYVFFIQADKEKSGYNSLYHLPVLGGSPKKLIEDIDSPAGLSPDGTKLAFLRGVPHEGKISLIVAGTDGSHLQELAHRKFPGRFIYTSPPAWSPNGKTIAVGATSETAASHVVVTIPSEGGQEKTLGTQQWSNIGAITWTPDGQRLLVDGSEPATPSATQIWEIGYPQGSVGRVTNDLNRYSGVSLTSDGTQLVTVQREITSNLWLLPKGNTSKALQITQGTGKSDGIQGVSFMPDGRLVYSSSSAGRKVGIFMVDPKEGAPSPLTTDNYNYLAPSACADSRHVVFVSDRAGTINVWKMDIDGSNLKQLTSGALDTNPVCSPDSQWVYYNNLGGGIKLWKVPIGGGTPEVVTNVQAAYPAFSADGKKMAVRYLHGVEGAEVSFHMAAMELDGTLSPVTFPIPATANLVTHPLWSPDSKSYTFVDNRSGACNIWAQPISGGPAKPVTSFRTDQIFDFAWSRAGDLVVARGSETSDVVLISNLE